MAFDLNKLATAYDFILTTKSFGGVKITSVKTSHLIDLENLLFGSDIDGVSFSKELLLLVGCKQTSSNNENSSEEAKDTFSKTDLTLIDDEDIEVFAKEFLANNSWLFKTHHKAESQIDNSEKIEKGLDEKNSAYLLRVFKIYLENEKVRLENFTGSISNYFKSLKDNYKATDLMAGLLGKSLYKDTTLDLLRTNSSLSDKLHESILDFNKIAMTRNSLSDFASQPSFEPVKFPENPIYETNKRLNTLISTIESMKPLVADSAELIRSMNGTAIQMQVDFIKSSSGNQLYAKWAMTIAVVSLLVTSFFSWLGHKESNEQGAKTEKMIEIYQQDIFNQNKKFEDTVRVISLNAEADAKRQAQNNELLQTLKENAKNKSK